MKYIKTFESFIFEDAGKPVVFFPGRFQPFHKGHLEALKRTSQQFKLPVIAVQIVSQREESPFPVDLLEKMGKDIVKANNFIEDFIIYPPGEKTFLGFIIEHLQKKGYDPIGMGCGSDRFSDYNKQVAYMNKPNSEIKLDPNFTVKMVDDRGADGPSGTRVRQAIRDKNQGEFDKLMPNELHKYYSDFEKYVK
jgi:cytidyltransferase-like protein